MSQSTSGAGGEALEVTARGPVLDAAHRVTGRLWMNEVPRRLAEGDPELWGSDEPPGDPLDLLPEIAERVDRAHMNGLTDVVLIATGGPALAATAIARSGTDRLTVLDTVDPGPVRRILSDPDRLRRTTVVIAGEPPGREPLGDVFATALRAAGESPDEHFLTLPGRQWWCLGALTEHTLLPAALAGADVAGLVGAAAAENEALARQEENPGLALGAILGGCARPDRGGARDKAVLAPYPPLAGLGPWVAYLLGAVGVLPIVQDGGFPVGPAADRFLIAIGGRPEVDDATVSGPLGAQFAVWEYATAVAAYLLGVAPHRNEEAHIARNEREGADDRTLGVVGARFDEDLSFSEGGTMQRVDVHAGDDVLNGTADLAGVIDALLDAVPEDGYLTIMSYMDPDPGEGQATAVRRLAATLAARTPRAVTLGRGVRSPANAQGVHLLISGNAEQDTEVRDTGADVLSRTRVAEAVRDAAALRDLGHPVVHLHLNDRWAGLARLLTAAQGGQG